MFWRRDSKKPAAPQPVETADEPQTPQTVHGNVSAALKRCLKERTDIAVTLGYPPRVFVGRLTRVGRNTIVLTVPELERGGVPLAGHICGAVFHHGPRSGGFLSAIREIEDDALVLERPGMVTYVDARRSFRIPVSPSDGLDVQLTDSSGTWSCKVLDLSRGGIGLRFREEHTLPIGVIVQLRFTWAGVCFEITCLVARQINGILGLIFNVADGDPEAEQLYQLIGAIERSWLRRERESLV